jgi:hypothetical protein
MRIQLFNHRSCALRLFAKAHAGFQGDGIEGARIYMTGLMGSDSGFTTLSFSSKGLGFGLKGHDFTAQASGLGIGTAQKVACGLKGHDCAFVHGDQVIV